MSIAIVDYGMSNLGSVIRAFEECGASNVFITNSPQDLKKADKIVLPGVGTFKDGMESLNNLGLTKIIKKEALINSIPLLGICLGMQLLADVGVEGGETRGLGLIPGKIIKLMSQDPKEKIPHVGWNEVILKGKCLLFDDIESHSDFYFVHSYHFLPEDENHIIAITPHCGEFISGVNRNNIFGTQFHPEKSGKKGFKLIKNFINI